MLNEKEILNAYKLAIKTRKNKLQGVMFNKEIEKNLNDTLSQLKNRTYIHGNYKKIILNDGKKRYIFTPHIRDHLVHHLLYRNIYQILDSRIPYNSFASRKGKGIHKGLKYFQDKLYKANQKNADLWYMKVDMSKYFYSIPHAELKSKLFKFIKNKDLIYLINLIINSYQAPDIYDHLFPKNGDYNSTKQKGLPIGAITSQVFANFYLYDVDHYINHNLKPQIYLRYMDDLIFVDTIENLKVIKKDILKKLNENKLFIVYNRIKVNKLSQGINLLGFKVKIKNNKIITEVTRNNKKKLWKLKDDIDNINFSSLNSDDLKRVQSVIESRKSHFKHTYNSDKYLREYSLTANSLLEYLKIKSLISFQINDLLKPN